MNTPSEAGIATIRTNGAAYRILKRWQPDLISALAKVFDDAEDQEERQIVADLVAGAARHLAAQPKVRPATGAQK